MEDGALLELLGPLTESTIRIAKLCGRPDRLVPRLLDLEEPIGWQKPVIAGQPSQVPAEDEDVSAHDV